MLKKESHPEVLREIALFIHQQSEILSRENKKFREDIIKRDSKNQEWLNQAIAAQLNKLQRRFFENGRETLASRDRRRRDNKDQLLLHAQSLAGEPKKEEFAPLPVEEAPHFAEEKDIIAIAQAKDPDLTLENAEINEIKGFFETSTEITITERTYKKVIHKRQKYRVRNKTTGKKVLVTAKGPLKLLPGAKYSVDLALGVVRDKFLNHLPYERQLRDMTRAGLDITVMTMFRLSEQVAVHMEDVAEEIKKDIFRANLACHLDETTWPILQKDADDGQMWVLSNQGGSYYQFEPTRSGKIADELLEGYSGSVLTDKYAGYLHFRKDSKIVWGLCWSHARREFLDLEKAYPEEVFKVVTLMDDLFDIERKAKTFEELKVLRNTESQAKLLEIKTQLEIYRAEFFDRDDFCKAIHYVLSAWVEFTAFTRDLTLPLSNNDAERALRHAVLGRKNYNGSKTINGADVAATLFTIIESCKKVELYPVDYMKYVITENQNDRTPLTPLNYAKHLRGLT